MIPTIQFIYPYYENPKMLALQLGTWAAYPWQFKERLEIIIVDDGSERDPAKYVIGVPHPTLKLKLYRIKENIPWNQNGAHNLGMQEAHDGWCVMTDIDHVVTASNLNVIYGLKPDEKRYYTFGRREFRNQNTPFKRHPNSWLLTREMFFKSGGYDEDFSGYYGSDSTFRRALDKVGRREELESPHLVVYDETVIADANTTDFGRKDSKYHSVKHPHLLKKRHQWTKAVDPLRFEWERVI